MTATASSNEQTPLLAAGANTDEDAKPVDPCDLIDLTQKQRFRIMLGLYCAVALGALDMTITAALIGPIAASFNESHQSSWLGTSFLLANITFTPLYGRLCDIIGRRAASGSAIALFAAGTLACALAPSFWWLIAARFLAGAGGGGMNTTSTIIGSDLFPLRKRGLLGSISTAIWAIGGASGGPLGGFLADWLGWRSAFMLQVPLLLISLFSGLKNINYTPPGSVRAKQSVRQKLGRIDFIGCGSVFICMGAFLILLGAKNNDNLPWNHPVIITACVVSPVFLVLFIYNEAYWAKEPILPFRILRQRTPMYVMLVTLAVAVSNFGVMYSLPQFFLAIDGTTASEAGAHLLPTSIGNVIGGFAAGYYIHKTGKYRGAAAIAGLLPVTGVALLSNLKTDSSLLHKWLGVGLVGIGFNAILNASFVALMASVPHTDVPAVTGAMWLFRTSGQVLGVASTSAIIQATLEPALRARITGKGAKKIIKHIRSDSSIIATLPHHLQVAAREAYALALRHVFWFCTIGAACAWLSVCFVPNLDLDPHARPKPVRTASQASTATVDRPSAFGHDEAEDAMAERRVEADAESRV